jgi:hypothetical protein
VSRISTAASPRQLDGPPLLDELELPDELDPLDVVLAPDDEAAASPLDEIPELEPLPEVLDPEVLGASGLDRIGGVGKGSSKPRMLVQASNAGIANKEPNRTALMAEWYNGTARMVAISHEAEKVSRADGEEPP